jgi:hypothetical protein
MRKLVLSLVVACVAAGLAPAERHPKAEEIQAYINKHPFESRRPDIVAKITAESMSLNQEGMRLYGERRYGASLETFQKAIAADDGNSIAYYNAACVMALQYAAGSGSGAQRDRLLLSIVRYLKQAIEREWYWALQMMVDTDLDPVRSFSGHYGTELRYTLTEDIEWGDTINILNPDGTATNSTPREDRTTIGYGYYSIIGDRYVFEYMPAAASAVGSPPRDDVTYFFPIELFLGSPGVR